MAYVGPAGLSSDSGLGGSTDGSIDILVFGSVVDSVTEEGKYLVLNVEDTTAYTLYCIKFVDTSHHNSLFVSFLQTFVRDLEAHSC